MGGVREASLVLDVFRTGPSYDSLPWNKTRP